jgi:hypothetical protein
MLTLIKSAVINDLGTVTKPADFHWQTAAPCIFAISYCHDLVPQFAISVAVEDPSDRVNLRFSDPDADPRITPDVFDPSGVFTGFSQQVETFTAHLNQISISRGKPLRRPIVVR